MPIPSLYIAIMLVEGSLPFSSLANSPNHLRHSRRWLAPSGRAAGFHTGGVQRSERVLLAGMTTNGAT